MTCQGVSCRVDVLRNAMKTAVCVLYINVESSVLLKLQFQIKRKSNLGLFRVCGVNSSRAAMIVISVPSFSHFPISPRLFFLTTASSTSAAAEQQLQPRNDRQVWWTGDGCQQEVFNQCERTAGCFHSINKSCVQWIHESCSCSNRTQESWTGFLWRWCSDSMSEYKPPACGHL